jgi:hypothetical protein
MKSLTYFFLFMAGLAVVLTGCSEPTTPVTEQRDKDIPSAASLLPLATGCPVAGSVLGEGRYFVSQSGSNLGMAYSVKFAVAALKFEDGGCVGQYVMIWLDENNKTTVRILGKITDIKFFGNVAMLAGEVQNDILVDFFGKQTWRQIMVVTDNRGRKSDRMSNPWVTSDGVWPGEFATFWGYTAEEFLVQMPINLGGTGADYPLAQGQIKVK